MRPKSLIEFRGPGRHTETDLFARLKTERFSLTDVWAPFFLLLSPRFPSNVSLTLIRHKTSQL